MRWFANSEAMVCKWKGDDLFVTGEEFVTREEMVRE